MVENRCIVIYACGALSTGAVVALGRLVEFGFVWLAVASVVIFLGLLFVAYRITQSMETDVDRLKKQLQIEQMSNGILREGILRGDYERRSEKPEAPAAASE